MENRVVSMCCVMAMGAALAACGGDRASSTVRGGDLPSGDDERSRNRHEAVGTNPFVAVKHDPLSTFAADVDTASYEQFRRAVRERVAPRPESVRLEDFVNYFAYDYPEPDASGRHPFSITLDARRGALGRDTTLLRVGVQARKPVAEARRRANLVFLVDVSGSMSGPDRLPLVKQVLTETVGHLEASDRVAIVTYASSTRVALASTPVAEKETLLRAISELGAGGSTAGGAGIDLAYEQAHKNLIEGGLNHVLLCTDGDFNVGASSDEALLELIRSKRGSGVTLTTLGFGTGNLNDAMMEKVSAAGNGIYGYIADEEQAARYVRERMLSTLQLLARDVKLQIEFNPAKVYAYRQLGYEDRALADSDFERKEADAGEVGAGHRVTALYELVLTGERLALKPHQPALVDGSPADEPSTVPAEALAAVRVRYKPLEANDETPSLELAQTLTEAQLSPSENADLRYAAAVAAFAEILKESPFATPELMPAIRGVFEEQRARDSDREELHALVTAYEALDAR